MRSLLVILDQVTKTPAQGVEAIFKGLGEAFLMVKKGFYALAPEIMSSLGEFWIFLLPFAMFFIVQCLNSIRSMIKGF